MLLFALFLGFLAFDSDPARTARQQRPNQADPQTGQNDHNGGASHLAHVEWRRLDENRGAAQGSDIGGLWQEEQVSVFPIFSIIKDPSEHIEIREDHDHRGASHLAHVEWRGLDENRGAIEGFDSCGLWQEEQVSFGLCLCASHSIFARSSFLLIT